MPSPDRQKQERLLNFAGWLHNKHRWRTIEHGEIHTEVRFTREDLGNVSALSAYSLDAGDAGERALLRDVEDLRAFGMEVSFDLPTQQWVSKASALTDEECRALAAAALYVLIEDGSSTPDGYHVPGAGLSVEGAELIVAYAPTVDLLVDAIRTRSPIRFRHRGAVREVDPWHVFMLDGRWYLVARDRGADERRAFALDAIDGLEVIGPQGSFQIPRSDWGRDSRTITDPDEWVSDADVIDVFLVVDPRLIGRAEATLGAQATGNDGSQGWVEMICRVRNIDAFITRLWGLRARCVVTRPPAVREQIVSTLKEMI
jgi:predicted DNA-binding transcriptional regulator YafY